MSATFRSITAGSEAIDLAAAPVLSEVALAVTSDDVSALSSAQAPSSGVLSGGATPGTASPMLTQSLVSTILSSSPKLPANAVLFNNDAQEPYGASGVVPLSEQLRRSSGAGSAGHASSGVGGIAGSGRPTSEEFSSPPPSLSLSPSASTTSPISSTPGSPVQALHPGSASGSGIGQHAPAGAQFGYGLTSMEQLETGVPMEGVHAAGADGGALAMQSPPGSSSMSGVSLSGNKDSKRRLSMIRWVSSLLSIEWAAISDICHNALRRAKFPLRCALRQIAMPISSIANDCQIPTPASRRLLHRVLSHSQQRHCQSKVDQAASRQSALSQVVAPTSAPRLLPEQ